MLYRTIFIITFCLKQIRIGHIYVKRILIFRFVKVARHYSPIWRGMSGGVVKVPQIDRKSLRIPITKLLRLRHAALLFAWKVIRMSVEVVDII